MRARRRGLSGALAAHQLDLHPDFDIDTQPSIGGGHASMNELISNRGLPTAVFAACDEIAFGALRALEEHGLSSPEDVSIVGIDDHPLSPFARLTTMAQPVADQGALSAMLLLEQLHGSSGVHARNHVLPATLIQRGTTRRARG
jgi:DNA-binding LacI/PurR family transcriptional regulator